MKEIVIATKNKHKVIEFKEQLELFGYKIKTLIDYPNVDDIVEDGVTFEENAYIKAKTLSDILKMDVIADDSGLCVDYLNGAPGVYSARYAGEDVTYDDNNKLLLKNLEGVSNREAHFVTVMCYLRYGKEPLYFKGTLEGSIATEYKGNEGFGYDPIFIVKDTTRHLAEFSLQEKNQISHRMNALRKLIQYFQEL